MRYFRSVNFKTKQLPEVVSVDEFKGNSGGQKYNSIITDPQNCKVIDILPNRYENDLIRYFSQFESKNKVKYFVCDMNPHFRQVGKVCFKNAVIVADRYHVIQQVNWAMERVRKNAQNKLFARFRKYFKKSRYLLTKPFEKLTEEEMGQLALMFEIAPRPVSYTHLDVYKRQALYGQGREYLPQCRMALEFLMNTTGPDGLRPARTDNLNMTQQDFERLHTRNGAFPCAHYNAFYLACLLLYGKMERDARCLEVGERGMRSLLAAYPKTVREQSGTDVGKRQDIDAGSTPSTAGSGISGAYSASGAMA